MGKAMVVFNVLLGSAIAVAFFLGYSDRSWSAALHWAVFYSVGVGIPLRWSCMTARALRQLNVPLSNDLRMAPLYPAMAGVMTLLMGISLIREALLTR